MCSCHSFKQISSIKKNNMKSLGVSLFRKVVKHCSLNHGPHLCFVQWLTKMSLCSLMDVFVVQKMRFVGIKNRDVIFMSQFKHSVWYQSTCSCWYYAYRVHILLTCNELITKLSLGKHWKLNKDPQHRPLSSTSPSWYVHPHFFLLCILETF